MPSDDALTDAERIALGRDPVQGERLYDLDDLWRVLERLGHEPGEHIPTTVWDDVDWVCPLDDCDGGLAPIDTRTRDLPTDPDDLDESVDHDDPELYLQLSEAQSPTVPVVVCSECESVFEANFRRLRDPEKERLPDPRIVETPGMLSGRPRIEGTRIGVEHVWRFHEQGHSIEDIAQEQYPILSEDHVRAAIKWAREHPDRITDIRREDEELRLRHDILQSTVDAGVAECIDGLWSLMADTKATDIDPIRPVASLLRNGFENADGIDITIDTDRRRVTLEVSDGEVAGPDNSPDSISSDEADSLNAADGSELTDVNERVTAEWIEETTPFDRVRTVMAHMYEAHSVDEIADRAHTTPTMAQKQLQRLADVGFIEESITPVQSITEYRRSTKSLALEQAERILSEVKIATLEERIKEMEEEIRRYQERFEMESPDEVTETNDKSNREALYQWQTTRRNLEFAKVALTLGEAIKLIDPQETNQEGTT